MPYTFLLSFATLLLLTGCLSSPKPVVHEKLSTYDKIKAACTQNPPEALSEGCTLFLADLNEENSLLDEMQVIKEDEKEENTYIALADREEALSRKLKEERSMMATQCQSQLSAIITDDDINSAAFCLLFDESPVTLAQYNYLKKYAPRFDNNLQYSAFEKQYAQKKLQEGIRAMNKGDKHAALNAFKTASEARSAEAAYLVGIIYEEKHIQKAISWHTKAVTEGVALSKINLARLYLRVKLPKKARAWYLSAAKDNNALAQYRLFKMDAKSKSKKAQEAAQSWLVRSAGNNYPQAQYIYGLQLLKQKKESEAQQWLEKANANGISGSDLFLGQLYFEQERYEDAYPLLVKATSKGAANVMLAKMYENALGVKRNTVLAYRHYKKAHEQGYGNYVADLKRLQKKLSKKDRQTARYITKKEAARAKELNKRCGLRSTLKNIKVHNRSVHIVGVGVKPLHNANGFIVYGDNETSYYIIDPDMASTIEPYAFVDLKTKATAKAIRISNDDGALQQIFQFYPLKNCAKK